MGYYVGDEWYDSPQQYDPYGTRDSNYTYGVPDDQGQPAPAPPPAQAAASWPPTGTFGPGDQRMNPGDGQYYVYTGSAWIPWNNGDNAFAKAGGMHTPIPGSVPPGQSRGDQDVPNAADTRQDGFTLGGGGLTAPFNEPFQAPQFTMPALPHFDTPQYAAPPYEKPPAFSYADWEGAGTFKAPTLEEAQATPGYRFRLGEGLRAINNSAASQGSLLTGGTFKGLQDYAQNFANSNYQNDYTNKFGEWSANANQSLNKYATNRANAADLYNTNYHTQFVDPYNFAADAAKIQNQNNLTGSLTQNQNAMQGFDTDVSQQNLAYNQAQQDWLNRRDTFWGNQNNAFSKYFQTAGLGAGAAG